LSRENAKGRFYAEAQRRNETACPELVEVAERPGAFPRYWTVAFLLCFVAVVITSHHPDFFGEPLPAVAPVVVIFLRKIIYHCVFGELFTAVFQGLETFNYIIPLKV